MRDEATENQQQSDRQANEQSTPIAVHTTIVVLAVKSVPTFSDTLNKITKDVSELFTTMYVWLQLAVDLRLNRSHRCTGLALRWH